MRVFLDTNVLIAAFATRGLCSDVVRVILERHELLTSDQVLEELERVLETKLGVPAEGRRHVLEYLRQFEVVSSGDVRVPELRDPTDAAILAAAIQGAADVLVTGDQDLLSVNPPNLKIVTPRGFWELIGRRNP